MERVGWSRAGWNGECKQMESKPRSEHVHFQASKQASKHMFTHTYILYTHTYISARSSFLPLPPLSFVAFPTLVIRRLCFALRCIIRM